MDLGSTQPPIENEYQEHFLGVKAAGAWGWPQHFHVPNVMKSGSLNLLEPSGPHRACYGTALSPFPVRIGTRNCRSCSLIAIPTDIPATIKILRYAMLTLYVTSNGFLNVRQVLIKLKTNLSYTKPLHLAQCSAAKRRAPSTTSPTPSLGGTVYTRLQAFLKHAQDWS